MKNWSNIAFPIVGLLVTLVSAGILTARFNGVDKTLFLPGETTHGHYQIELSCGACHDVGMGINEQSCIDCHGESLKSANDTHPISKFTDPRNADRVEVLDARKCVTCHKEHQPAITHAMGVTIPSDYCYHCHQQTLEDRPSHKGFAFESCATAGCHNYHDNTALYESFLVKHGAEPDFRDNPVRPDRNLFAYLVDNNPDLIKPGLTAEHADSPAEYLDDEILRNWSSTAHAAVGVNCRDCHEALSDSEISEWNSAPTQELCSKCHQEETSGFLAGHHGMRLAQSLDPMTPSRARITMKSESAHRELTCVSCHDAHEFDTKFAAVEACLQCHDDQHSLGFLESPHFELWQNEISGEGKSSSGVSCASCHLPRERIRSGGEQRVLVQHNQNKSLRPNEKMIRAVCMDCHGLAFAIDALADPDLIQKNFNGRPEVHIESIDLALKRQLETQKTSSTKN